jgi:hypothetical protein
LKGKRKRPEDERGKPENIISKHEGRKTLEKEKAGLVVPPDNKV